MIFKQVLKMAQVDRYLLLAFLLPLITTADGRWRPCVEVKRELRLPCQCAITVSGLSKSTLALEVNCDRMVLSDDVLVSLRDQPIISFSHQFSGHQNLPSQYINNLPDSLEKLDLSNNAIHRLMDRQLQGRNSLKELILANNALGDSLNPIFSSNEFHQVSGLKILDLRSNKLRGIEEGIFKGCPDLEELYLDSNNLINPPIESLKGPKALRILSLAGNNIGSIQRGTFVNMGQTLLHLDLSNNELLHLEDDAMYGMTSLLTLNISHNELRHLNSDVFKGAFNLQQLDISMNFLQEFPTEALQHQRDLKFLNISNNMMTELEYNHLTGLDDLQILDLSHNNIGRLGVKVFSALSSLFRLDLSFNSLRAIEESSFDGLTNLKWLSLQDNNILLVPSAALTRLPSLIHLHLEFNRIAALSSEIFRSSASQLISFSLTRNLVRELPPRLFFHFDRLLSIDLSGNMIPTFDQQSFIGVEDTLVYLDMSYNRLSVVDEIPLRNLISLNLAGNLLKQISPDTFKHLNRMQYLNISNNPLYGGFPPIFPRSLISLDVASTGLRVLPAILLLNSENLEIVSFSGNELQEINGGTFKQLLNLTTIDLSYNEITTIENGAFIGLKNLYNLNLRGNKLRTFEGESFNTGTGLEILDLSYNMLEHLSSTVFLIHPRLRQINLSGNRFSFFAQELIKPLQFLEHLNLANNQLTTIAEFAFAQISRLRELNLSENRIQSIEELAFHNSTQLQQLDLSKNNLEILSERMLEGIRRMEKLDLSNNQLTSLPEAIFDTTRIHSLEKIDLSGNRFAEIPTRALERQMTNLNDLNLARNRLSVIFSQDIINSVKKLDLSENPLSEKAIDEILGDAKVLRYLNIASCGIRRINRLEAPFLRKLNVSRNNLEYFGRLALDRTTMLEKLDISRNHLQSFDNVLRALGSLAMLKSLDISGNDVRVVNESSLLGLENLKELKMYALPNCTRIEKNAFKSLSKLRILEAFDFPKLGYFDVQGIIKDMRNLEVLDIEIKDVNVGNEQLSVRMHPRLKVLILRGERIKNILSSLLVGIKSSQLSIGFINTSIDTIPTTLLFPVPRSTQIQIDVSGSKFKTISPQITSVFDERNYAVKLKGLRIKIPCDCDAKYLWKWYKNSRFGPENSISCSSPDLLVDQNLMDVTEEQLYCGNPNKSTTAVTHEFTESTTGKQFTSPEPEIIWTVAPSAQDHRNARPSNSDATVNVPMGIPNTTDDTLIIMIVGGVVTVIAIIVIIICIFRLRSSNQHEENVHAAMASNLHEASMLRPPSTYSGKINQDHYMNTFNGSTLGHTNNTAILPAASLPPTSMQMLPFVQALPMVHSAASQQIYGYYENSVPMYVTNTDSKLDR